MSQNHLPSDDCDHHIDNFIIAEKEGEMIGTGAIEVCGVYGLVRSIAVIPEWRGRGIARKILTLLEDRAYEKGMNTLYLLTETAVAYFGKLDFSVNKRTETPEEITKTKQFRVLCPSTATVMCREIVRS
ncbi:MAG: GNAT family N-acetyltransferase [Nitrospirae bacterium]|nr:GNAT family N-acetyltransferase [Candidatus Manganitrophaceae bacterium]